MLIMKKLSGLGMGLSSLIPKAPAKITPQGKDNIFYIEVHKLQPNRNQPRREFDEESLQELASSIKKYGILQPILVSKIEHETERGIEVEYEVLAGERRLRAAKLAGLPHVPVIIKDNFEEDRMKLEVALIENVQRQNLNALEEAEAYLRLIHEFDLTQQEVAQKVGKSREVITNTLRLLDLPPDIKKALCAGQIARSHARALLAFRDNPKKMRDLFHQVLLGNLASADVERVAKEANADKRAGRTTYNARFDDLQNNLSKNLGTAVLIKSGGSGGMIQIKFSNIEQLNKIVKTIVE